MQAVKSLFKIAEVCQSPDDASTLFVVVTEGFLTDVFHSVSLNLSASLPAADHHPQPAAAAVSSLPSRSQRKLQAATSFDLGNALKSVQASVQTLGSDVDALINAVEAAEQFFSSGETYQNSASDTVNLYSFNVDNATHAGPQCQFPIDKVVDTAHIGGAVTGTCLDCYAYIGVTITAAINIQQGQLVDASVIMDGTATFQSTFDLVVNETDVDVSKHITTLVAGPIEFLLAGIPIRLTSSTPISLGVIGTVKGNLAMSADVGMSATVKAGFQLANNQTQFINQLDFAQSGSGIHLPSLAAVTDSAALRLYILPIPAVNIDYLGGPKVGLKTYFEGIVDFAQTASTDATSSVTAPNKHCSSGPSVVANVGLDGTIGANVRIGVGGYTLFNRSYPSLATFSLHHAATPLYCPYGSASTASSGRRLQQATALGPWAQVGNVYQGEQIYTGAGSRCQTSAYPPFVLASLQLVNLIQTGSGPLVYFLATINSGATDFSNTGYAQLNQQLYTLSCYDGSNYGSCTFDAEDDSVNFVGASQGSAATTLQPQYGYFDWANAGTVISLQDTLNCVVTNLTLVTPQPSQSSSPAESVPTAQSSTCPWASTSDATANSILHAGMVKCVLSDCPCLGNLWHA